MPPIWDESYLNTLLLDAEDLITASVDCIFDRISIPITKSISVYTLPEYVNHIIRITWKGKKLDPLSFNQFCILNPASAFVSESVKIESPESIPKFYVRHPSNYRDVRFWPTPNEDIAVGTSNLFGSAIISHVIISCYRNQDTSQPYLHLPSYIIRRIKKAYVLSRAFAKEGKGQNLSAAKYYTQKLTVLLEILKKINSNVYVAKQQVLNDSFGMGDSGRPAYPVLPPNFE